MKASWNGQIIAQSDNTILIEGNHYFPKDDVKIDFMANSDMHTTCPWKGEASYYDLHVDGEINQGSAWFYAEPKQSAIDIVGQDFSNYVAFWRGVEIRD